MPQALNAVNSVSGSIAQRLSFEMEESEKRRERLRAMRVEAAAEAVPSSSSSLSQQSLIPTPLANPLLENQDSNTASTPPRFDFYTDPMSAYATNKHRPFTPRPHPSPSQCGPSNPGMPPSGVHTHQFQSNYGPHQGINQGGVPYCSPSSASSPMGFRSPYPMHQGQGGDPYCSPSPASSPMGIRSPYPMHQGSPNFSTAPGSGNWFNNTPSPVPGHGGSPYPVYQGSPNFRSPPPPPPPPQGMGHWSNNNPRPSLGRGGGPSPSLGRGRGQWDGSRTSPSPSYSGGRGRGRGNGDGQSWSFYSKSMVQDPWESLTPVIWQGLKQNDLRSFRNNRGFNQRAPNFQKTPSAKKPRVSNCFDASNSNKGGSLADFLAETFDEAVEDASSV